MHTPPERPDQSPSPASRSCARSKSPDGEQAWHRPSRARLGQCVLVAILGALGCSPPAQDPKTAAEPAPSEGSGVAAPGDIASTEDATADDAETNGSASAGAEAGVGGPEGTIRVSVLAVSEGCPDDGILPDQGYVAPFSGVLGDVGKCHTSPGSENSIAVKLDAAGTVQGIELVKGNGACLRAAVKKVRFPSYRCAANLVIVSAPPGPSAP